MLEEAESGWFRHTGSVRGSASQADRYSPKPSFQAFQIPLRPEESIFKFVMETSGCNYGKRPNFPPPFFSPSPPFQHSSSRNRHPTFPQFDPRRMDAKQFRKFSRVGREKKREGRGEECRNRRATERHWSANRV